MPTTITLDQAKSFGLFMLTAVLSGRGSEIIDLAKQTCPAEYLNEEPKTPAGFLKDWLLLL